VLTTAVVAGWMALQRWMAHAESARCERAPGDSATARRRLVLIAVFVVVWFMVVMQLVTGYA
jgi:hypothetical protein